MQPGPFRYDVSIVRERPSDPDVDAVLAGLLAGPSLSVTAYRFFQWLVPVAPYITSVIELERLTELPDSTLACRFMRAGLPSPKQHLFAVRLCYAKLWHQQGTTKVETIANRLGCSSPNSFNRSIRIYRGMTAAAWLVSRSFATVLADTREQLLGEAARRRWDTFSPMAREHPLTRPPQTRIPRPSRSYHAQA